MKNRKRKLLAVLGATALVATGCGSAAGDDSAQTASASSQTSTTQRQPQDGQAPEGGGPDVSALAETLGVSESDLQTAMQELRPDQSTTGQPPDQSDMAAKLAEALDLDEATVADALADNMPTPPNGTPGGSSGSGTTTTPSDATQS